MNIQVSYKEFFHRVTTCEPLGFQMALAQHLVDGKNVILQAPTGAGKTWAATVPFIFARQEKLLFPSKMIYSLPMRVLANSLHGTMVDNSFLKEEGFKVTIQTGERPSDRYFLDGDIVFTTIDQTLSSLLSIPLSLPIRQANINAGAFVGAYLVFDEFHLLDPERSLSTLFHLLRMLKGISPFCLMTATLSQSLLQEFGRELDAEIVSVDEEELRRIPSQRNKNRKVQTQSKMLDAEAIVAEHREGTRTIVICNRVKRCQEIYLKLRKQKEVSDGRLRNTEIICIHSRFFGRHRTEKEGRIKKLFKRGSTADAVLVATQVIEVGLDITCDVMHTEISPINSLLQRAGRCARFENESGKILVYPVVEPKSDDMDEQEEGPEASSPKSRNPYAPYSKEFSENTLTELEKLDKLNLDYVQGQKLIDSILTTTEIDAVHGIQASQRREDIQRVWTKPEKAEASRLIRLIDSVSIVLLNSTDGIKNPYGYETLSVHRWTLLNEMKKRQVDDWKLKTVVEPNILDNEFLEKFAYSFDPVSEDAAKHETFLVANISYANYNSEIGLNFREGSECSQILEKEKEQEKIKITKDTYEEHIRYLMAAYSKYFRGKLDYSFQTFQKLLGVSVPFDELIGFMIVLHDYGKLNVAWQKKAWEHQRTKELLTKDVRLAHTDFDAENDKRVHFPPHAGAGALVALSLLQDAELFKNRPNDVVVSIAQAVATSIMRHHSPVAVQTEHYQAMNDGVEITQRLLREFAPAFVHFNVQDEVLKAFDGADLRQDLIQFRIDDQGIIETMLYYHLVRILRVCDQKSFEIKEALRKGQ